MKAEASLHFTSASSGDGQRATIAIPDHPFSVQGHVQHRRSDRATDMRSSLTPVHAGVGETTPQFPSCLDINTKSFERLHSTWCEVVRVIGT